MIHLFSLLLCLSPKQKECAGCLSSQPRESKVEHLKGSPNNKPQRKNSLQIPSLSTSSLIR